MARPRLRDIAVLAGVSEPTVSRVLNGRTNVSDSARTKVGAALQKLGYSDELPEPTAVPRNVVGLVCGEFMNPVFPTFVHHISVALATQGILTQVVVHDEHLTPESRCVQELRTNNVDGAVFLGGHHAEVDGDLDFYRRLAPELPLVLVNGRQTDLAVPHVLCDEAVAAHKATSHLIALGHQRIGCAFGSRRFVPTERMIRGYRRALAEHNLAEPADAISHASFTLEGGSVAAHKLVSSGFTGLICSNDLMALGALRAVPGSKVSVVGYDGTDFTAMTSPALTTLRQPFEDMAAHIADAMVSEIDGSHRLRDHYVFEPELLFRSSTRPPADVPATA